MNRISRQKLERILNHIKDAYSPNTIRAYRSDFSEFIDFCTALGAETLPADPIVIAQFVLQLANEGNRSSTIRRKVASISAIHRFSYLDDPTKHPEVKIAIRKINRKLRTRFQQSRPINKDLLTKMLAVCGNDLRGIRNRLLLLLAYTTLRRRSELVSLQIEDIEFIEGETAVLLLRQSKTDQNRMGIRVLIDQETSAAMSTWLEETELESGFLLRGITGSKLNDSLDAGQVSRIFKRLATRAGIKAGNISGHSTRIGAAQDLLQAGKSIGQIMALVGWSKIDTVIRYVGASSIDAISSTGNGSEARSTYD